MLEIVANIVLEAVANIVHLRNNCIWTNSDLGLTAVAAATLCV